MLRRAGIKFPNITIETTRHYDIIHKISIMMKTLENIQRDLNRLCKSDSAYDFMRLRLQIKEKLIVYNYRLDFGKRTEEILDTANETLDRDLNLYKTLTKEEYDASSGAIKALLNELNLEFEYTKSKNEFIRDVEKIIEDEYKIIKGLIKILEKQDVDVSELIQKSKNSECRDVKDQINELRKLLNDDIFEREELIDPFSGLPAACCNVEATKTLIALKDETTIREQDLISQDTAEKREIREKNNIIKEFKKLTKSNDTIDYIASIFSIEELSSINYRINMNIKTYSHKDIGDYIMYCSRIWLEKYENDLKKGSSILKTHGKIPKEDELQTHEYELYERYVSIIGKGDRSIYGTYEKKTLNNYKFLNPDILYKSRNAIVIYGLKTILSLFDPTLYYFMTQSYNMFLTRMLSFVMYPLARAVYNFGWIAQQIVETINKKIGFKYIIFDCKEGIDSYTCGRGISEIEFNFDKIQDANTDFRILVHNTVSTDNDHVDFEHMSEIAGKMPENKGDTGTYPLENYNGL